MIKAVFLDYTGTMVRQDDPYTKELIKIFMSESDFTEPQEALKVVWTLIRKIEFEHYLDTFIGKDEMVDLILDYCEEHHGFTGDREHVHEVWRNSWVYAPLFDDVRPFIESCPLPVCVVTNDDICYIEKSLEDKELKVAGVVSAEMVRANKPHPEILQEALRVSGVSPEEAVLIGDSEESDVPCAQEVGIKPILLDRKGTVTRDDIQVIRTLEGLAF